MRHKNLSNLFAAMSNSQTLLRVLLAVLYVQHGSAWISSPPASACQGCRGVGVQYNGAGTGAGFFYLRTTSFESESRITLSAEKKKKIKKTGTRKKKTAKKKKNPTTKKATLTTSAKSTPKPVVAATKESTTTATIESADEPVGAATIKETHVDSKTKPDLSHLPYDYAERRKFDESLLGDLTGGRPGAIIETAEQLELKEKILAEIDQRGYDPKFMNNYGELAELAESDYDIDDPDAIDSATLGTWTIYDLETKFDYEWDPLSDEPDPNQRDLQAARTIPETPKDEDGIEVGFTSYFGPSNPIDARTIMGSKDSYMIDEASRDESRLTPQFAPDDPEMQFNEDFIKFRRSLDIMETYIDPFLSGDIPVPRHVAKWHGYPEQTHFRPQNYTNNRYTPLDKKTDFDSLGPFRARQLAVEMARAQNAEWMTSDVHLTRHKQIREPYEKYQTLMGTLRKGDIDPDIVQQMEPALKILGSSVELLSTWQDEDTGGIVLRFHYHGLMKNKYGMKCWAESLFQEECGMMNVNNVVFETGFRRRDPAYDGGDYYYGPSSPGGYTE